MMAFRSAGTSESSLSKVGFLAAGLLICRESVSSSTTLVAAEGLSVVISEIKVDLGGVGGAKMFRIPLRTMLVVRGGLGAVGR
jgi:hypothetical protein